MAPKLSRRADWAFTIYWRADCGPVKASCYMYTVRFIYLRALCMTLCEVLNLMIVHTCVIQLYTV